MKLLQIGKILLTDGLHPSVSS